MDPLVGRTLDNKYLIEKLLGKGGMGSVYQSIHTGTKRTVAVKVIAPQYMRNRELLIRFQREAEASGRLRQREDRQGSNQPQPSVVRDDLKRIRIEVSLDRAHSWRK